MLGCACFGAGDWPMLYYEYMKNPDNPKQWIVDAAETVKRIFAL